MKNNMNDPQNQRRTFCNETLRPLSAPPIANLLNISSTDLLYHSYYKKHSRKDVRLPLPDFFFAGQSYLSTYFYDYNDCTCQKCGACTFNTIKNVQLTKKSLIERINEDFPSDTTPFEGVTRCTTPIGQKKEPENMLMYDILQFVSLNKSFLFKESEHVITSDSLTQEIIILLCKDQEASRFIQKRLEYATESELDWLFDSISNHLIELSCDLFGNYVIQKYITTHGEIIYDILRNRLSILSYDIYGCRVVQKLLDLIYFNLEDEFFNSVIDLTKDQNGNHVIQKVIEVGKINPFVNEEEVFKRREEFFMINDSFYQKEYETVIHERIDSNQLSELVTENLVIENHLPTELLKELNSTELSKDNFILPKEFKSDDLPKELKVDELKSSDLLKSTELLKSDDFILPRKNLFSNDRIKSEIEISSAPEIDMIGSTGSESISLSQFSSESVKNEYERIKFLITDFEVHALEMCKHKYGCRAVQRLFEFCYEECTNIIQIILNNLNDLIYDQYGNYVIQHLLNYENERKIILDFLCDNVMKLSCHKFASNVVEKGISVSGDDIFRIGDIVKEKYNIITMANSGFGNYVLQRMIESRDKRVRDVCKANAGEIRRCVYGKQVLSKTNNV